MSRKLSLVLLLAVVAAGFAFAQQGQPVREITRIAGEVYRFRNNFHYSVFAVTPQGIIATDPIDAEAAQWLKSELQRRFRQPVRYLIYSHDHADHISGGQVFADTAVVVAHQQARADIIATGRDTAVPNVTFAERMDIELGGTTVELHHLGRNHSDNMIVMRFPREGILFAVDFIPIRSLAFRDLQDGFVPDWIESLEQVEQLQFEILAPGHGPLGGPEHVVMFREYFSTLYERVQRQVRTGASLATTKRQVTMAEYSDWGGYEQMRELNVEGMYRLVSEAARR